MSKAWSESSTPFLFGAGVYQRTGAEARSFAGRYSPAWAGTPAKVGRERLPKCLPGGDGRFRRRGMPRLYVRIERWPRLPPGGLLLHRRNSGIGASGTGGAGGAAPAIAQRGDVEFEFVDGAAQRIAVHAEFARGLALVPVVFLQHGQQEAFLEFADGFGVEDSGFVHLRHESFQLILHGSLLINIARHPSCLHGPREPIH